MMLAALLYGCAAAPSRPTPSAETERLWQTRQARLAALQSWTLSARIAVSNAAESWSSHVRWEQRDDHYEIDFSTFLGQRVAQLRGGSNEVVLVLPDRDPVAAPSASALLADVLGWHMPVESLRYWVIGLPVPGHVLESSLDASGRLAELEQDGWHVSYSAYVSDYLGADILAGHALPRRVVVSNPRLRIRVVVDEWRLG
jgi:outer membrane lipoprotein LolB